MGDVQTRAEFPGTRGPEGLPARPSPTTTVGDQHPRNLFSRCYRPEVQNQGVGRAALPPEALQRALPHVFQLWWPPSLVVTTQSLFHPHTDLSPGLCVPFLLGPHLQLRPHSQVPGGHGFVGDTPLPTQVQTAGKQER